MNRKELHKKGIDNSVIELTEKVEKIEKQIEDLYIRVKKGADYKYKKRK